MKKWWVSKKFEVDSKRLLCYIFIMKTAVHIPDNIFNSAEEAAKRLKMTRSQLYTKAVKEFIEIFAQEKITDKLNAIYGDSGNPSCIDPKLYSAQLDIVEKDEWK